MLSTTRFSPSSYPTTSSQVGSETEMACGTMAGMALPKGHDGVIDGAVAVAIIVVLVGFAVMSFGCDRVIDMIAVSKYEMGDGNDLPLVS